MERVVLTELSDFLIGQAQDEKAMTSCTATIGKSLGLKNAMKGDIGAAAFRHGDLVAAAVFAVNCVGDVLENGEIIAGVWQNDGTTFADSEAVILDSYAGEKDLFSGILAAHAAEMAIIDGVKSAQTYGEYLSYQDRIRLLSPNCQETVCPCR